MLLNFLPAKTLDYSILFLSLTACQPEFHNQNPFEWQEEEEEHYESLVNKFDYHNKLKKNEVLRLVNKEYPIELMLFKDNKFFYVLEDLGEGVGTWKYEEGQLKLYAERKRFVMNIGVHAIKEQQGEFGIEFIDRWGNQYLQIEAVKPAN